MTDWEGSDYDLFKVLSQDLPGGTEKRAKSLSHDSWPVE